MKYTIITINYNNKSGLKKTIESVINQCFQDFEYIIIDGGSTDGSLAILDEYKDSIDFCISEADSGIYNAMNKGIRKARGQYLNFMNSGDSFHSHCTLKEVDDCINGEDIITGSFYDEQSSRVHSLHIRDITLFTLLKETFNHQSTFYKRTLFNNRLYDESYRIQSDSKFNLQAIVFDNCTVKIIDVIVTNYDFNGISGINKDLVESEWRRLLRELFPERILKDYEKMYSEKEVLLVKLLPYLKTSLRLQHFIYLFTLFCIKLISIFERKK